MQSARHKENKYKSIEIDGKEYIEFVTNGKYSEKVIVDKDMWFEHLNKYSWTITGKINLNSAKSVKTSIKGVSISLSIFIIRCIYKELFTYNREIDHINTNPLDNRLENLRIVNRRINMANQNNNILQHCGKSGKKCWQVHVNLDGIKYAKYFKTYIEAEKYFEDFVIPSKLETIKKLEKKDRDIEFERGLISKIDNGELRDILEILSKYKII